MTVRSVAQTACLQALTPFLFIPAAMPVGHYENFPVASILLPRPLRRAVVDIYRFARTADDIADEGDATPEARLAALEAYRAALHALGSQQQAASTQPAGLRRVFDPLADTIKRHQLPLTPFLDLLSAFAQDVRVHRYPDFASLEDYCRRSANPVGRLMLHLFGVSDATALAQSDAICTALQLINFLQDVRPDFRRGRLYLPQSELAAHGVSEDMVAIGDNGTAWRTLMAFQVARCRTLLDTGAPLGRRVEGRCGLELRLIVEGGRAVLARIEDAGYDVFGDRLVLRARDWPGILWRALAA